MSEPLDLESIRARVRGASLGPWRLYDHTHILKSCRCLACHGDATVWEINVMRDCDEKPPNVPEGDIERCKQSGFRYEDAEFIVHARFDVPRLLDEVDRLRAIVERPFSAYDDVLRMVNEAKAETATLLAATARIEALIQERAAPGWSVSVDDLRDALRGPE